MVSYEVTQPFYLTDTDVSNINKLHKILKLKYSILEKCTVGCKKNSISINSNNHDILIPLNLNYAVQRTLIPEQIEIFIFSILFLLNNNHGTNITIHEYTNTNGQPSIEMFSNSAVESVKILKEILNINIIYTKALDIASMHRGTQKYMLIPNTLLESPHLFDWSKNHIDLSQFTFDTSTASILLRNNPEIILKRVADNKYKAYKLTPDDLNILKTTQEQFDNFKAMIDAQMVCDSSFSDEGIKLLSQKKDLLIKILLCHFNKTYSIKISARKIMEYNPGIEFDYRVILNTILSLINWVEPSEYYSNSQTSELFKEGCSLINNHHFKVKNGNILIIKNAFLYSSDIVDNYSVSSQDAHYITMLRLLNLYENNIYLKSLSIYKNQTPSCYQEFFQKIWYRQPKETLFIKHIFEKSKVIHSLQLTENNELIIEFKSIMELKKFINFILKKQHR